MNTADDWVLYVSAAAHNDVMCGGKTQALYLGGNKVFLKVSFNIYLASEDLNFVSFLLVPNNKHRSVVFVVGVRGGLLLAGSILQGHHEVLRSKQCVHSV